MSYLKILSKKFFTIVAVSVLSLAQLAAYVGYGNVDQATASLYQSYCSADQQGSGDIVGDDDIQQGCYTYSPGPITTPAFAVGWSWDEISFSSGSNACGLVDNDANGFTDVAICGTASGIDTVAFTVYTCDDSAVLSCGTATAVALVPGGPPANVNTCSSSITGTNDPYNDFVEDTLALCILAPADFGITSLSTFIDACSYTTAPTTDAVDCIFRTPNQATITVTKNFAPSYSPGTVSLTVEGAVEASSIGHGGTTGPVTIPTTESTSIGENATGSTDLTDYSTSFACFVNNIQIWSSSGATGATSRSRTIPEGIINEGDSVNCTITNSVIGNGVDVTKIIDSSNGGSTAPDDYSFVIDGYNENLPIPFEPDGTNSLIIPNGTYSIYEVEENSAGYETTYQGCEDIVIDENNPVFANCTITNTAQPATITIAKTVVNNNGGDAEADEFIFRHNGEDITSEFIYGLDGSTATATIEVPAGVHTITEDEDSRYETSYADDCIGVELAIGENVICTIINNDLPGQLQINKELIQDNGGVANYEDFSFKINDGTSIPFNDAGMISIQVDSGVYSVAEDFVFGYDVSYENCTNVEVSNGGTVTCTITNDDQQATLTVIKEVIADDGGELSVEDFILYVTHGGNQTIVESGIEILLDAGTYVAGEEEVTGWTASGWMGDCASDGSIILTIGGSYVCTIENDDEPATLTIEKELVQDNGGTMSFEDFGVELTDNNLNVTSYGFSSSGTLSLVLPAGTYIVDENETFGYTSENGCGEIVLENGEDATCTITNDDIAPVILIEKYTNPCFSNQDFSFSIAHNEGQLFDEFLLGSSCQLNEAYLPLATTEVSTRYDSSKDAPFSSLIAGETILTESENEGWFQDGASCYSQTDEQYTNGENGAITLYTEIGKTYDCSFYNSEDAEVTVYKFHDHNEDGERSEDEPLLPGWDVELVPICYFDMDNDDSYGARYENAGVCLEIESLTGTTGDDGSYTFEGLFLGQWALSETIQDKWQQSGMYCDSNQDSVVAVSESGTLFGSFDLSDTQELVNVYPGASISCYIGNHRMPEIEITKTSTPATAVQPGQEMNFELVVTVPDVTESGNVYGDATGPDYIPVQVTDNMQDEFEYVENSFRAVSNVRGDLVAAGITTDPDYQSPGTWSLTSLSSNFLVPGEVVTLTYRGIVGDATPAGNYPTTARVVGYSADATTVVDDTAADTVVVIRPMVLSASSTPLSVDLQSTGAGFLPEVFFGTLLSVLGYILHNKNHLKR
jgi:hypothetical protein